MLQSVTQAIPSVGNALLSIATDITTVIAHMVVLCCGGDVVKAKFVAAWTFAFAVGIITAAFVSRFVWRRHRGDANVVAAAAALLAAEAVWVFAALEREK